MNSDILKSHGYIDYTKKVYKWMPGDTENRFNLNYDKASALGWTKDNITYNVDSLGHRNDFELDNNTEYNVYLGCSFTYGIGVPNENVWVHVLNNNFTEPAFNLGVPGASVDTCYRLFKYYVDKIKIKRIFLLVPPENRREVFYKNKFEICSQWSMLEAKMFLQEIDCELNCKKTIEAIQWLSHSHGINCYIQHSTKQPIDSWICRDCSARDLQHPGIEVHKKIANEFLKKLTAN